MSVRMGMGGMAGMELVCAVRLCTLPRFFSVKEEALRVWGARGCIKGSLRPVLVPEQSYEDR